MKNVPVSSLITAVIVLAISGYVLIASFQSLSRDYIEEDWLRTSGVVLNQDINLSGKKNINRKSEGFEQTLNYEYTVGEQVYQSNSVSKETYVMLDQYKEGAPIDVYYNPADVTESVLVRSPLQKHFLYIVIGICLLLIGVIIYTLQRDLRS